MSKKLKKSILTLSAMSLVLGIINTNAFAATRSRITTKYEYNYSNRNMAVHHSYYSSNYGKYQAGYKSFNNYNSSVQTTANIVSPVVKRYNTALCPSTTTNYNTIMKWADFIY